jgi:hypothetical protein
MSKFIPLPGHWYSMDSCPHTEHGGGPVLICDKSECQVGLSKWKHGTLRMVSGDLWIVSKSCKWSPIYTDLDQPVTREWCERIGLTPCEWKYSYWTNCELLFQIDFAAGHPPKLWYAWDKGIINPTRGQVLAAIALEEFQ